MDSVSNVNSLLSVINPRDTVFEVEDFRNLILRWLDFSHLLNLRLVNTQWNQNLKSLIWTAIAQEKFPTTHHEIEPAHLNLKNLTMKSKQIEKNLKTLNYTTQVIINHGIYCLKIFNDHLFTGSDLGISIYEMKAYREVKMLLNHEDISYLKIFQERLISYSLFSGKLAVHQAREPYNLIFEDQMDRGKRIGKIDRQYRRLYHSYVYPADIQFWDLDHLAPYKLLKTGHKSIVNFLKIDETRLFSCSADKTIKVWRREDHQFITTIVSHQELVCLKIFNEQIIAGAHSDNIFIWSAKDYCLLKVIDNPSRVRNSLIHSRYPMNALTAHGHQVIITSEKALTIWNMKNGKLKKAITHLCPPSALSPSHHKTQLHKDLIFAAVAVGETRKVVIYNLKSKKELSFNLPQFSNISILKYYKNQLYLNTNQGLTILDFEKKSSNKKEKADQTFRFKDYFSILTKLNGKKK